VRFLILLHETNHHFRSVDRPYCGYALADERTGTTGDSVGAVKNILIQIEHQWGDAMVKDDVPTFSQCVADDWILTTSNGSRITEQIAQADLSSAFHWLALAL
jgi:hypothetical protein